MAMSTVLSSWYILTESAGDQSATLMPLDPFYKYVGGEKQTLNRVVVNALDEVIKGLNTIEEKCTHDVGDAYMATAMLSVYANARKVKGKIHALPTSCSWYRVSSLTTSFPGGKHAIMPKPKCGWGKARHNAFRDEVTSYNNVWKNAREAMENDMTQLLDTFEQNLIDKVEAVFQDIATHFDQMCQFRDDDDASALEAEAELEQNLANAEAYLDKEMKEAYEALRRKFR